MTDDDIHEAINQCAAHKYEALGVRRMDPNAPRTGQSLAEIEAEIEATVERLRRQFRAP